MKVKDGFGSPNQTDRLQSLQSRMNSLKELNNYLKFDLRYKNGWDWRDWSGKVSVGEFLDSEITVAIIHELYEEFQVSGQCRSRWWESFHPWPISGLICICGHPNAKHEDGGMCQAGYEICYCRKPVTALTVSDARHFFRATKGPHEAHALVLGLESLTKSGGSSKREIPWVCNFRGCSQIKGVNPVRMRNDFNLAMGLSVHDNHRLMCEPCLFRELNG